MLNNGAEAFAFDFVDFRFIEVGGRRSYSSQFRLSNQHELRLLGRIIKGRITMGDSILVPVATGLVMGKVNQFWESFDDWLALPFYTTLTPEAMPDEFCLCITGIPPDTLLLCPGTAYHAPQDDS